MSPASVAIFSRPCAFMRFTKSSCRLVGVTDRWVALAPNGVPLGVAAASDNREMRQTERACVHQQNSPAGSSSFSSRSISVSFFSSRRVARCLSAPLPLVLAAAGRFLPPTRAGAFGLLAFPGGEQIRPFTGVLCAALGGFVDMLDRRICGSRGRVLGDLSTDISR